MARPARTNAEWFKHPAAFRNDRRVKAIRARYGAAGYGLLTMLLELLTDAPNTQLCLDDVEIELLAGDLGSSAEEVSGLIQVGEKVGLFVRNEADCLKCPQLDEWLAAVFDKRNRSRNDAEAAKLSQPATEMGVSVTETPQSRVEESRVEKSIIKPLPSVEDAASAAVPAPVEEKLAEASLPQSTQAPESPATELRTPGGAADVGTRKAGKVKVARELLTGDLASLLNPGGMAERVQQMKQPLTQFEADALVSKYGTEAAQQIVKEMANYAKLTTGYVSANLTAQKWLERRQPALALVPPAPAQQNNFSRPPQPAGQLQTRATAIAGANAMFDALAAGQNPY